MKMRIMSISKLVAGYGLAILMSATVLAQSDYGTGVSVGVPYVAPGEIALDGDRSEASWDAATVINPLAHVDEPYSHKGFTLPSGITAEARLLFGEGVVYLYVEVEDGEQYFNPSAAYNSDVILIGVDLIHTAGVTDQQTDPTFSGFASNAPDQGPVVYQALPNAEILANWAPGPVSNGWADGQAFANATSWGVEMAIYGAEIAPGAEIGLNVGLFIAKEAGVFDRNNGDGGFDYTYAFASWQVCNPFTQSGTFWCGPGGTMLSDAHSLATARLVFDGNGDGVPDDQQENVTAIPSAADDGYVTFETSGGGFSSLNATATHGAPEDPPGDASFPAGFLDFTLEEVAAGETATVTIFTDEVVSGYWKYGHTPDDPNDHWYEFTYDGSTGAEVLPDGRIVLHFVDGERGDDDLTTNGVIVDPGAPAFQVGSAIQVLRTNVEALGLKNGLENAFVKKLANAAASFDRGNTSATAGQLGAFVNHVEAKRGKDLSDAQTDGLIVLAEAAIDELGGGTFGKTAGARDVERAPDAFKLEGNYPNPFNPQTSIRFALPEASHVRLTVYDALGREVKTLVNGMLDAGRHDATFDAGHLSSGTYLYRLETPKGVVNRTMVLMK